MKKIDIKNILLFVFFGVFLWIFDAVVDYFYFYPGQGSFAEILLFHPPAHEIYIRLSAFILIICFGFIFSYYISELKHSRTKLQNIFNNVIPICITNKEYDIIGTNRSYDSIFRTTSHKGAPIKCYNERPSSKCRGEGCPVVEILERNRDMYTCETVRYGTTGTERYFIVSATPYLDLDGQKIGVIETFQEITPRKKLEKEKEKLIRNLQEALAQVKVLKGFLPICASCKKIRDDKGYWTQIETYIRNHSEAEFSHGICPDCAEKHYGFKKNN